MQQVPAPEIWQERIEGKVDQILDRLTRMEERQSSLAGKVEAHDNRITELAERLRKQEHGLIKAESDVRSLETTQTQQHTQLSGRWAAVGAVAVALLSVIGSFAARIFFP
ncbi:hypothetical protein [Halomonas caseinilytica]|uniref:Uncharacterized protein n=2 Tax=Halomonas TaxID=2745 RepID=A0A1B8P401_HALEL|nr:MULTISPECIES: hypothetical protein [Halomonas]OBX36967.1 hypothetical protein A8U91_01315 [Halomonas elongata]SEN65665.1 hypothetical protein SAMN04487952_12326 [Halomonas caseinilytica]